MGCNLVWFEFVHLQNRSCSCSLEKIAEHHSWAGCAHTTQGEAFVNHVFSSEHGSCHEEAHEAQPEAQAGTAAREPHPQQQLDSEFLCGVGVLVRPRCVWVTNFRIYCWCLWSVGGYLAKAQAGLSSEGRVWWELLCVFVSIDPSCGNFLAVVDILRNGIYMRQD